MALSASWQNPAAPQGATSERQRRRRALQAARHHTRLVKQLRILLPAAGLIVVFLFFGATRFSAPEDLALSTARLSVTPSAIIMEQANLKGFDREAREFSVKADRAIQALKNPNAVRLDKITATLGREGVIRTTITAESGDFDRSKDTLQLQGSIAVDSAEGYSVRLTDAGIDFTAGTLASPNPVTVTFGEHKTTSESILVTGGGEIITLQGNVRTTLATRKRERVAAAPVAQEVRP